MTSRALFQFARFAIVGTIGFVITTSVIYATRGFLGPALAGLPAFLAAVTTGWALNRTWTFRYKGTEPLSTQWLRYLLWTAPTVAVNSVTYEILVLSFPLVHSRPIIATLTGALLGMFVSFTVMRWLVFRQPPSPRFSHDPDCQREFT